MLLWLCDRHGFCAPNAYLFPNRNLLTRTLQMVNPAIDHALACCFSCYLISANDSGDFEKAWRFLGGGPDYGPPPEEPRAGGGGGETPVVPVNAPCDKYPQKSPKTSTR